MTEAIPVRGLLRSQFLVIACFVASAVLVSSCSRIVKYKDETIPQPLTPVAEADFETLVSRLKLFTDLESMRATRVSMNFIDAASLERSRWPADATIVMKRPEQVRVIIQVPVAKTKLAEMVADAERFRVAIYYDKYKRFLLGTNKADYSQWKAKLPSKTEAQSAFTNARPFHFTDALLVRPLQLSKPGFAYSLQEELMEEPDTRPNAKKKARVLRSFYVVAETEITDVTKSFGLLKRRFWFDRNDQLQLKRQQVFDAKGRLITDIRYANYIKLNSDSQDLRPSVIEVRRPYDRYAAELTFLPDSVEFNIADLPDTAFVLENTEKLPETDLDKSENK